MTRSSDYKAGYNAGYQAGRRKALGQKPDKPMYVRFNWECYACEARGFILRHRDDTDEKAEWRREVSHRANKCRDECPRPLLEWRPPFVNTRGQPIAGPYSRSAVAVSGAGPGQEP